jgi:type IV pilus assembly protein PilX
MKRYAQGSLPMRRRQRGVTLFIALIVLVAMTMAAVAMMRSVDTATVVAGNIGFRQSAVNAADQGVQTAYAWLGANVGGAGISNDSFANGYASSVPAGEAPDWYTNSASWANKFVVPLSCPATGVVGKDCAGNAVSYVIHRLCPIANCAPNATCGGIVNICGQTLSSTAVSGEGVDQSAPNFFTTPPATHYRVTVQALGPRSSIAYVQTMLRAQ